MFDFVVNLRKRLIMSENERSLFWICVILTMAMAFTAMMISLPRVCDIHSNINFDYQTMIVTVLGIFVTTLIGWQIWQTIISREQIRNIEDAVHKKTKHSVYINLYNVFWYHGVNLYAQGNYKAALEYFMRSLDSICKCKSDDVKITGIIGKIKEVVSKLEEAEPWLNSDDVSVYSNILSLSKHIDVDSIIQQLKTKINNDSPRQSEVWAIHDATGIIENNPWNPNY